MKTCGTNMYELARECGVASMVDGGWWGIKTNETDW